MIDEVTDEIQTLKWRWHKQQLNRHPDCRDPDHPGCEICEPECEPECEQEEEK